MLCGQKWSLKGSFPKRPLFDRFDFSVVFPQVRPQTTAFDQSNDRLTTALILGMLHSGGHETHYFSS